MSVCSELDYEDLKEISLQVSVTNKAEYHSSVVITETKTYTIHVSVINQPEGPRFKPAVKVITISEEHSSITLNKVITRYVAIDSDTLLNATNVRYAKGQDVDNWLNIDGKTADIRLNKIPDYESKFLINGTYYAHIICITNEVPAKTATGTIAIQVKDFNDHCPVLMHQSQTLCYEDHVVYVTAVDKDHFPNAEPFGFKVDTVRTKESWSFEPLNGTTAIFRSQKTLWPGVYHMFVDVWDQQGKICPGQELEINVCTCDAAKVCLPQKITSKFGASGVLLMLLGLLLLLLLPLLLLFCLCGGAAAMGNFKPIPFNAKEHLITYNIEGQGEDKDMALLQMSTNLDNVKRGNVGAVGGGQMWGGSKDGGFGRGEGSHWTSVYDQHDSAYHHQKYQTDGRYMYGQRKDEHSRFEDYTFDGLALSDAFLSNYYAQKASHVAKKQDMGDCLIVYEYEDREPSKESFEDICGLIQEDNDLAFLDDLDMRFKTLAEICIGSKIETEISTTVPVTSKPVLSTTHKDVSAQSTVSHSQSQEKTSTSIIQTAGAQQSSSMSSTGVYVQEKVMVPNQTLLVQQPAMYYTSATPVYVMEAQPTLMMTPSPVLGLQENLIVEERKGTGASHRGTTKREAQHYQSLVLVEKQPMKGSMQAQGAAQIVSSEMMHSMEAQGVRQVLHPSVQLVNTEIMQSVEAQGVRQALHPSVQMVNTEMMQSTESREVRRAIHPTRRLMEGATRSTEVSALLDMGAPQSL
ncbi:desmoglein-2 [Labeo rohita]|nr:desmoglein-2 [Labeo rohita]XP_050959071.1 desmoglein-2 [Labeo rohita]